MSSVSAPARPAAASSWAAALPLLCAVHCLAAPVLAAVAPALALPSLAEHAVQLGSVVLAGVMARSGIRAHGDRRVLVPMVLGAVLWIASDPLAWTGAALTAGHVAGGLLLAAGMAWNGHLRHKATCGACACPAHSHD